MQRNSIIEITSVSDLWGRSVNLGFSEYGLGKFLFENCGWCSLTQLVRQAWLVAKSVRVRPTQCLQVLPGVPVGKFCHERAQDAMPFAFEEVVCLVCRKAEQLLERRLVEALFCNACSSAAHAGPWVGKLECILWYCCLVLGDGCWFGGFFWSLRLFGVSASPCCCSSPHLAEDYSWPAPLLLSIFSWAQKCTEIADVYKECARKRRLPKS